MIESICVALATACFLAVWLTAIAKAKGGPK